MGTSQIWCHCSRESWTSLMNCSWSTTGVWVRWQGRWYLFFQSADLLQKGPNLQKHSRRKNRWNFFRYPFQPKWEMGGCNGRHSEWKVWHLSITMALDCSKSQGVVFCYIYTFEECIDLHTTKSYCRLLALLQTIHKRSLGISVYYYSHRRHGTSGTRKNAIPRARFEREKPKPPHLVICGVLLLPTY